MKTGNGKTAVITGATGGLGQILCRRLAEQGYALILMDRNPQKAAMLDVKLKKEFPDLSLRHEIVDLECLDSVRAVCDRLEAMPIDVLIHNAGAYAIPRHACDTGYDTVFQINFVSPYYITRRLLPLLRQRSGHVVAVGSIAHRYSRTDPNDIDFSGRPAAAKAYGNAKRYLMFSLYELFREETAVTLSVVHPGVTFTNITAHYPPWLFAIIKYPMKVIFPPPKRAVNSLVRGVAEPCGYGEWIGPWLFDVWGAPKKSRLHGVTAEERQRIGETARAIWEHIRPAGEAADPSVNGHL